MKGFKEALRGIKGEEKGLFWAMVIMLVLVVIAVIFGLASLKPESSVVKVAYGDIGRYQGGEWSSMANSGGYQDGGWMNMLAYPILALVVGVLHNIIAVQMYERKGAGVAKIFVATSIGVLVTVVVVLRRLLGEG